MSGVPSRAPTVSVAMVVFQQEAFVRDAVQSILSQECDPVEILICDDCSTDRTFEIVEETCSRYDGPHRVRCWKRTKKAGPGNLQLLLPETTGDIVVVAHGDDISAPNRIARQVAVLVETGAAIVSSNATLIDEDGTSLGLAVPDESSGFISGRDLLATWDQRHLGATHAFRRAVFEDFEPWSIRRFFGGADTIFPVRAELLGGCYFAEEPLVNWRQHDGNLTKRLSHFSFPKRQKREFRLTRKLAMCQALLQDVRQYAEHHPESEIARAMCKEIEARLFETLENWIDVRNRLLMNEKHPIWVDLAEIEGLLVRQSSQDPAPSSDETRRSASWAQRLNRLAASIMTGQRRSTD